MAIVGAGYEVTHVSAYGQAPLGQMLHFRVYEQLTVLYGLNGAGKSRFLQALSDALSGCATNTSRADLHFRVDVALNPNSGFVRELSNYLSSALKEIRGEMYTSSRFADYEVLYEEPRSSDHDWSVSEKLYAYVELYAAKQGLSENECAVLHRISERGRFALQASKTGRPKLWLTARPSDDTSLAKSLEDVVPRLQRTFDDARSGTGDIEFYSHPLVDFTTAGAYYVRQRIGSFDAREPADDLCIPLMPIGRSSKLSPISLITEVSSVDDLDFETLKTVTPREPYINSDRRTVYLPRDKSVGVSSAVSDSVAAIELRCNQFLAEVLIYPPTLRFRIPGPDDLLFGERPHWQFSAGGKWVAVSELSSAQLRWSRIAIALSLAQRDSRPTIFLCDEPERGLHRLAEKRVSDGIAALVTRAETGIIAATHSPLVVGNAEAKRVLTYRDADHNTALREWNVSLTDSMDAELAAIDLGLAFGDLLQLMNVAIIVEGLHDEYVFKALLRSQLGEASAGIFSMRGAKHPKSLVEAQMLFQATNAPILVVLDSINNRVLQPMWRDIVAAAARDDGSDIMAKIGTLTSLRIPEADFLAELAKLAAEQNRLQRIEVHGLSLPDVICYLPESQVLLRSDASWDALIGNWTKAAAGEIPRNIKGYLKSKKYLPQDNADINNLVRSAALKAANSTAAVHPDILRLGEAIVDTARRPDPR